MSLPKKKTRRITVNGRTYLWMVRRSGDRLRLTVQAPSTKLLQTSFDAWSPRLDDYGDRTIRASLEPAQVRQFILETFHEHPVNEAQ